MQEARLPSPYKLIMWATTPVLIRQFSNQTLMYAALRRIFSEALVKVVGQSRPNTIDPSE